MGSWEVQMIDDLNFQLDLVAELSRILFTDAGAEGERGSFGLVMSGEKVGFVFRDRMLRSGLDSAFLVFCCFRSLFFFPVT